MKRAGDDEVNAEVMGSEHRIVVGVVIPQDSGGRANQERPDQRQLAGDGVGQRDSEVFAFRIVGKSAKRKHGQRLLRLRAFRSGGGSQRGDHLGSVRPFARLLCQQPHDQLVDCARNVGAQLPRRARLSIENLGNQHGICLSGERVAAGEHLVHHHAKGIEVGAFGCRLAAQNLGRHVRQGAGKLRGAVLRSMRRLLLGLAERDHRQPEVHHLDMTRGREHDVGSLDVAMHDAACVGCGKSLRDLQRVLHDLLDAERTVADTVMQRFAFHALHDDHRLPVVLQNVVHRANERMIERRSRARFAKKHLA